jgi:hypothetical protein
LAEIVVSLFAGGGCEAILVAQIAVGEVVALAAGFEVKAENAVGGGRAAVRCPVEAAGGFGVAERDEVGYGCLEDEVVCGGG